MDEKQSAFEEVNRKENCEESIEESGAAPSETAEAAGEVSDAPETAKGGKRLKKSGRRWLWALGAVVAALLALYLGLCVWAHFDAKIAPNTYFAGINYGGLTQSEAEAKLTGCIADARAARVEFVLTDGETVASVALGELAVEADVRSTVGTMRVKPYHGFLAGGAYYVHATLFGGREVIDRSCDEAFLAAAEPVLNALSREAVEFSAEVTEEGRVLVTKARDGRALTASAEDTVVAALRDAYFGGDPLRVQLLSIDEDAAAGAYEIVPARPVELDAEREKLLAEKVNASYDIENGCIVPSSVGVRFTLAAFEKAYGSAEAGESFYLVAAVEQPEVTTEALEEGLFRDELSSYTTRVSGAVGRRKNVRLTAERINGYILNAGDTMQYAALVAPFTEANGYFPAPGYIKGKTVDMYGGGACQASSTLYAAVLYADLEIVQRVNHGFASDYIGLGLDATVAEGGPEFEFRNNTLYPIQVQAEFFTKDNKDYLKITLLGTKTDDNYVKIVTELLSTTPYEEELVETDELAPGEREVEQTAYTGYVVKTYRNVYAGDGTLLSSAYEATSRYNARNRIIRVGKAAEPVSGEESGEIGAETGTADGAPEDATADLSAAEPPAQGQTATDGGDEMQSAAQVSGEIDIKNE